MLRTEGNVATGIASLLLVSALAFVAGVIALKTPLLLSDIREDPLGDPAKGRAVLLRTQAAHGGLDAWRTRDWIELELRGEIPFAPARFGFGGVGEELHVVLRFDPAVHGLATLTLDGQDLAVDTRGERDGLGLLAESVRHLWEFAFAMDSADVLAALPAREGLDRVFASWGTDAPQPAVDQYVLWSDQQEHIVRRFDSTGRAIAPFIRARVVFDDYRDVEGFMLPGTVTVHRAGERGGVVQAWRLVAARLGPAGPAS
jgi:hypothetical protein